MVLRTHLDSGIEENPHNNNGCVLALYFEEVPTQEEVTESANLERGRHVVGLEAGEDAQYEIIPNTASRRGGLVRVVVFNVG